MTNRTQTENDTIYIYREAESQEELEELLKVRYQCFKNGKLCSVNTSNNYEIELDTFDKNANHYGIFIQKNNKEYAIGYIRFVIDEKTKHSHWIEKIELKYPDLYHQNSDVKYSFEEKLDVKNLEDMRVVIENEKKESVNTVEVSRICVTKEFQSQKIGLLLIDFAFSSAPASNPKSLFLFFVKSGTEQFYTRNGAIAIKDAKVAAYTGDIYQLIIIKKNLIQGDNKTKIFGMAAALQKNNRITYNFTKQTFS
jgi:predicted GNAT family N-acyltransferase